MRLRRLAAVGSSPTARFLAAGPNRVMLVDQSEQPAFAAAMAALGIRPQGFATIRGFNYSNGRRVTLLLEERGVASKVR